jgi:aminopeptidase N
MLKSIPTLGISCLLAASLYCPPAWSQPAPPERGKAQPRRPFAKPGTPRRDERIRFFDIKHVKAELTLDVKEKQIRGTVTHTFSPMHPYLAQIELDCAPELKVSKVTVAGQGGSAVPCKFTIAGEKLTVALGEARGPDDTLDLAVEYKGRPTKGMVFVASDPAYPERPLAIWTQGESEDTHYWLPCYDHPNDRATSEMIITVENPLLVVSNGTLVETRKNAGGTTTYHWKMDVPHSSYLISLAVGNFTAYHDKVGNLPLDYYVAKGVDEATARRFMGKTPQMIRFFGEVTGQPYPYVKYAQTCLPEFGGGMENISATSMTDTVLQDEISALESDADGLVAHELAHQWFGDLLTCRDWSHIWLNEGFASYFDPLFIEHDRGEDTFRLEMDRVQKGYLMSDRRYRRPIVETRYESSEDLFDGMTYQKGACVLHALRGLLGDKAWWSGLRGYVAAHKFQVVDTDDFRKAIEAASGKDLKWFFDQWLHRAGHPELKVRWHYEDADKTVRVKVEQTQTVDAQVPLFRLPTSLEITEAGKKTRVVPIVIDQASHEFVVPAATKPRMVQIDPEGWLIKELDFEKSLEENLFQLEHAGCVLGRMAAAQAIVKTDKGKPEVVKALSAAWKREKAVEAQREIVVLLATGEESSRAALIEAARSSHAKIHVAALSGLAKLKHGGDTEALFRAAWKNPKEAYGARTAALRGLVAGKVKDADQLLDEALKIPGNRHSIAAVALGLLLETPGPKARELAVLYSRYGQPRALRMKAVGALGQLAKDDSSLQDLLITMVADPERVVRYVTWGTVRELKLKKAIPALTERLELEASGFNGMGARMVKQTLEALKDPASKTAAAGAAVNAKTIDDLKREAADLESKAKDLRQKIDAFRATSKDSGGGSTGSAGEASSSAAPSP